MIAMLTGRILVKEKDFVITDVQGVGYKVWARTDADIGEDVVFYTHLVVKEDALDLYGFNNSDELKIFESLINVSGVGPKTAAVILFTNGADGVKKAIEFRKPEQLIAPGVGKKTAERIVLELSGKLSFAVMDDELIGALVGLGYTPNEARNAAHEVGDAGELQRRIKEALRVLKK